MKSIILSLGLLLGSQAFACIGGIVHLGNITLQGSMYNCDIADVNSPWVKFSISASGRICPSDGSYKVILNEIKLSEDKSNIVASTYKITSLNSQNISKEITVKTNVNPDNSRNRGIELPDDFARLLDKQIVSCN